MGAISNQMSMRYPGSFALALAALALASPRAWADGPFVSVTESTAWQDNVTYAPKGDGIKGAFDFDSGVDVAWLRSLDFSTLLVTGLQADVDVCSTYGGLDCVRAGPTLRLSHKFGLGPLAPLVYTGLAGTACGFDDSERSKIEGDFLVGFSQRLSDAFQVALDGRLGSYDAQDIVFTGNYASLDASLNWDLSETWRVKVLAGWRNGDLVSNYAAEESPYGWIGIDPKSLELPGAWHYVGTFHAPYVAYRVSSVTWSYGLGVSPAIGPHTSLALEFHHYVSPGFDRYLDNVVSVSLAHRF